MDNYSLLHNRSIIEISGNNSSAFLMRITTNILPAVGKAVYSMMLNAQGKFLFDFFVINNDGTFLIDCSSSIADNLLLKLNTYNFRFEVQIDDVSQSYIVLYSRALMDDKQLEHLGITSNNVIQYRDPRFDQLGFRLLIRKPDIVNIPSISKCLYRIDKYKLAIPDGDTDLLPGKSFPLEYGSDKLHAISYSKGCYIGQELISRAKYQGIIRKRIYCATNDNHFVDVVPGSAIVDNHGDVIGQLCSSYHKRAITLIRDGDNKQYYFANQYAQIGNNIVQLLIPPWAII